MPKPIAAAVERADCDEPPETRPIRAWLNERTLVLGRAVHQGRISRDVCVLYSSVWSADRAPNEVPDAWAASIQ